MVTNSICLWLIFKCSTDKDLDFHRKFSTNYMLMLTKEDRIAATAAGLQCHLVTFNNVQYYIII